MLVLQRKLGEEIRIACGGKSISLRVVNMRGGKVRLGFTADDDVRIDREEIARLRDLEVIRP